MISIITRIQIEGNDTVSFLNGTNYVQGMSQIMPQVPTYISYGYDSISITQDGSKPFQFSVYTVTDVGGNSFTALNFQDPSDVVQAKTIEIYRLLVTAIFKGCCECGSMGPECAIQYTYEEDSGSVTLGLFSMITGPERIYFDYVTGNNQDFTNFFPIIQDGSWAFIFSKTDPTTYAVIQLSNFSDGGTFARFDYALLDGNGLPFVSGTQFCIDFTSVGGSLVQDWQDTLIIGSTLTQDNTVDGGGFDFVFDNNNSFAINAGGGSVEVDAVGASLNGGTNQVLVTPSYIDIITPGIGGASTGWVLSLTAAGHVEYVEAGTGTISSIGLFMPPAFTVSTPNPLTSNGDFTVTGAGTDLQYINGLGELATFPVYTVENGLHTKESPADPFVFHLGGVLIEDTVITTTDGTAEHVLGVSGTADQNTRRPFAVANLGDGGAAVFSDFGAGVRPNPTVEMITDNDLLQPILRLTMQGDLPDADNTMLRLRYSGRPDLATTTIDYQFRNNNAVAANSNFIGSRLSTEVVSFVDNNEETRFNLQLIEGGALANKLQVQGYGQLVLNEYGLNVFSNGVSNIDNDLEYVLAVDSSGNVYKKISEGGGTVTEIDATGLLTTSPNPITTTGTVTSEMNSGFLVGRYDAGVGVFQEITVGTGLTLSATGELTADGGGGGTYDSDQGVYKDTSLTNDTFMLGAPSGLQGTIPFLENRFVDVDAFRLQMEGVGGPILLTKDGGAAIPFKPAVITSVTDSNIPAGTFISENFDAVDIYTYGVDRVALIVENSGTGINSYAADFNCINGHGIYVDSSTFNTFQINSTSASNTSIDNVIYIAKRPLLAGVQGEGTSIAMSPGNDWNNVDIPIGVTLNCVVSDPGASGRDPIPATVDFRVDTNRLGVIIEHTSFIGNGQLRLHEYGQTPAQFYDPAPVWALGVDVNGNVVEIAAGGSGTTYNGDQGVYKDTSLTPETFMLGAPSGSQSTIAFSIDRYIDTSTKFLSLSGTGSFVLKADTNAFLGTAVSGNADSGYGVRGSSNDANSFGVWGGSKNGIGVYGESTNDYALFASTTSPVNTLIRTTLDQTSLLDVVKIERIGSGPINVGGGSSIATTLGTVLGSRISTYVSNGATGEISLAFQTRKDTATTESTNMVLIGDGQLQLNKYGQTPANFPDASPVWALGVNATGDVVEFDVPTGGGGIPFGIATGTDTYAVTAGTASTYTDGDAYLVRFTNGNTGASTLNVNGIGARDMYSNGDGLLIGGDIWAESQMLCVYDSSLPGFKCIGTSTNSLFAYVTNAEATTITKGTAVYAFSGTGDRLTVKKALATGDSTSAQTVGMVFADIAAGQKGIILIQGELVDLNLFPTSGGPENWVDGDPIYLSATTAGAVTKTKQYAPNHLVYLGICVKASNGTGGRMYVRIQNGFELDEIHNVQAQSPADKDTLWYDNSVTPKQWKTASIPTILGYTPERPIEKIVLSGGDITTTSNTAQNITGLLTSSLDANSSYLVLGRARIGCNNTGGVKFASTIPSGASISLTFAGINNTATTAAVATVIAGGGSLSGQSINNANTTSTCMIHGMIVTGATAGAVQLQFASTTSGQTSTIYGGSLTSIILIKMA